MQNYVQQCRNAGTFRAFERCFVPAISEGQSAAMPSLCSCHHYRTVCTNVEEMGISCRLRSTTALMPTLCSYSQRRYNCSNAIILFLPSMQHDVQQCRNAGTFRAFEGHFVPTISERKFAAMPSCYSRRDYRTVCSDVE